MKQFLAVQGKIQAKKMGFQNTASVCYAGSARNRSIGMSVTSS
jgi:hypothetical protein